MCGGRQRQQQQHRLQNITNIKSIRFRNERRVYKSKFNYRINRALHLMQLKRFRIKETSPDSDKRYSKHTMEEAKKTCEKYYVVQINVNSNSRNIKTYNVCSPDEAAVVYNSFRIFVSIRYDCYCCNNQQSLSHPSVQEHAFTGDPSKSRGTPNGNWYQQLHSASESHTCIPSKNTHNTMPCVNLYLFLCPSPLAI